MKKGLVFGLCIFLGSLFLVGFVIAESNSTADVAYIYKTKSMIDTNVISVFSSMGLSVDNISESSLPMDLSNYKFIFVGNEPFTKTIPIENYSSVVENSYFGSQYGLTDAFGISKMSSTTPLQVTVEGKNVQVYDVAKDNSGIYLYYYFLPEAHKWNATKTYAKTYSVSSGNKGDVVSFVDKGSVLSNGKTAKAGICFFGITNSLHWTNDAKELLKKCANFADSSNSSNASNNSNIVCRVNSECEDNNSNTQDVCLNPGTNSSTCSHTLLGNISFSISASATTNTATLSFSSGDSNLVYLVSSNGINWTQVSGTSYTFVSLASSTSYTFYAKATDSSNRTSDIYNVSITTLADNSGGGSGGGGGGSSSSSSENTSTEKIYGYSPGGICVTPWTCTDWGECKDNIEARTCSYPSNWCTPIHPKPDEHKACRVVLPEPVASEPTVTPTPEKTVPSGQNSITGAVIGALGDHPYILAVLFLVILAAVYGYVRMRGKVKKSKK